MPISKSKVLFYLGSAISCVFLAFSSGCMSGGYNLTRQYARWVNSQTLILRIILYIFTAVVFAITLLIDAVIFNTIDFWEGKVSAGTYEFKKGEEIFYVKHELDSETKLKRSTIQIAKLDKVPFKTIVIQENSSGEIDTYIDGSLHTKVIGINSLPIARTFDGSGNLVTENVIINLPHLVNPNSIATK